MGARYRERTASRTAGGAWILLALGSTSAAQEPASPDAETVLSQLGLQPNGAGAIAYIERLTPTKTDRMRIEWLISQLGSCRFTTRERATRALLAYGDAAAAALESSLGADDAEVRSRVERILVSVHADSEIRLDAALELLRRDRPEGAVPSTLSAARAAPPALRGAVVRTLKAVCAPRDLERLAEATSSSSSAEALAAIRVLAEDFGSEGLDALASALAHPDAMVRLEVALVLAIARRPESLPTLVALLGDPDTRIRARAISLLTAATGESFDFEASAPAGARASAIDRWRDWLRSVPTGFRIRELTRAEHAPVTSFWISSSGKIIHFDERGKLLEQRIVDAYDLEPTAIGMLVTERSQNRVRIIAADGSTRVLIQGLDAPTDADLTRDGHVLVVDGGRNRVVEYDRSGKPIRTLEGLSNPFDAQPLPNGHVLVADSSHDRVVEFSADGEIAWEAKGAKFPNGVCRLLDGRTLVTTYTSGEIVCFEADATVAWRTRLGGTVYCPRRAGGKILVACSTDNSIAVLDDTGVLEKRIALDWDQGFSDVGYDVSGHGTTHRAETSAPGLNDR